MKTLITGVAGTGKSTIVKALNERGIKAIDLHDVPDLFYWRDIKTGQKVEYTPVISKEEFGKLDRFCDLSKLNEIFDKQPNAILAGVSGGSNQDDFLRMFDWIILLQGKPETLVERMKTRTNKSGYGKTEAEQNDTLKWQVEYDPKLISIGAIPVSTEGDLDEVILQIINKIK